MVGSILVGGPGTYTGAAYVIFGHTGPFTASVSLASTATLVGAVQYDLTGFSVSSAGDFNGDGFGDVIVSAPYSDVNGTNSGSTYVVFGHGGAFPSQIQLSQLSGTDGFAVHGLAGDYAGWSVSSAGDVNGDGLGDLIIGAPNAGGSKYYGAAYVLYGQTEPMGAVVNPATLDAKHGFWVYGDYAGDFAGASVSAAGDINGDGFDDLIVGAPGADPHGASSGAVEVIYGGALLSASAIVGTSSADALSGTTKDDQIFGFAGDDVLTGFAGNDQLDGGTGNDTMKGGDGNDTYVVDSAGDVIDEQGNADKGDTVRAGVSVDLGTLASGAIENATLITKAAIDAKGNGADNVLTGNASANVLTGLGGNDTLIGGGGKDTLNGGDGNDVIVVRDLEFQQILGGTGEDTLRFLGGGQTFSLGAYAGSSIQDIERIDLSQNGTDTLSITKAGLESLSSSSNQLIIDGSAGDSVKLGLFFHSGGTQVVGGETYNLYTATGSDAVLVDQAITVSVSSSLSVDSLDGTNGFIVNNDNAAFEGVAYQNASLGDLNGDGFADLLISGPHSDGNTFTADLLPGGGASFPAAINIGNISALGGVEITGLPVLHAFPQLHGAGDFNGDGLDDIMVGSLTLGEADFILGSANLSNATALSFKITDSAGIFFSASDSPLGDFNGDGYDDVILSSKYEDSDFVVFGQGGSTNISTSSLNGSNGFAITGAANTYAGYSVSGVGDINGDGYDDAVSLSKTTASIVFGHSGASPASLSTASLNGTNGFNVTGLSFGSVHSLGDINGDGYDDFAVVTSGSGYVVFGHSGAFGASFDVGTISGAIGFKLASTTSINDVEAAGDFNGDGYSDFLVLDQHSAYVVYGHQSGFPSTLSLNNLDSTQELRIDGYDLSSVQRAGDINGDGFDDLVLGSYWNWVSHNPDIRGSDYVVFGGDFTGTVAHIGTAGGDAFSGSSAAESFVGGGGDDTLNGGGGADVFHGGAGNDHIHVSDHNFHLVDGGGGADTLHLDFAGAIDFGNLDGNAATSDRGKISNIETIDVTNGQNNALTLHLADVLDLDVRDTNVGGKASLDNTLKIDGNAGDTLHLSTADGWSAADTSTLAGYAIYTHQAVHVAVDTDIAVTVS